MDFDSYQERALLTDCLLVNESVGETNSMAVPMHGLASETGQLLSEYKKHLRDGEAHQLFKERVSEELGDLLWYIANVASKFDISLSAIAAANLKKVKRRWTANGVAPPNFDADLPDGERLPRQFEVKFIDDDGKVRILFDKSDFGSILTDNAYVPDGYRFHDVLHFAFGATLGWSPVMRQFLKCKRKSQPKLDEVEDGGRARVIEEGLVALAFSYACRHRFLEGISVLDSKLLCTIKDMTSHLEVRKCSAGEWERAILQGFEVWRNLKAARGGRVTADLDARSITFMGLSPGQESPA